MFRDHPHTSQRSKKRDRIEAPDPAALFPYQNFLAHLFEPVTQKTEDQRLWQANIRLATELAQLVAESAARIGIADHDAVYSLLCDLLTEDGMDQLHQTRSSRKLVLEKFTARVQPRLKLLKSCDHDAVLKELFLPADDGSRNLMMIFWNNLAEEKFKPEYLSDWMAIYRFLLTREAVEVYFRQLEDDLQRYCADFPEQLPTRADGKFVLPPPASSPYERFKILSDYLYQWAEENGFGQSAKIIKRLPPATFLHLLQTKTFFKDRSVNVGNEHGAWSHALQWYCIIEHHKQTHFLQHDPLRLYQELGDRSQLHTIYDNLWEILCDRINPSRYTSPEAVTHAMRSDIAAEDLPLLAESIRRLQNKMDTKYDGSGEHMLTKLLIKHEDEEENGVVFRPLKRR